MHIYLSIFTYKYIYICICVCVCMYIIKINISCNDRTTHLNPETHGQRCLWPRFWRKQGAAVRVSPGGQTPNAFLLHSPGVGFSVPFWECSIVVAIYLNCPQGFGHHLVVAIKKTIYHSWLGDVTHGDISHDPCWGRREWHDLALRRVHEQWWSGPLGGFHQPQVGHESRGLFALA